MARKFEFFGSYTSFAYLLGLYPNATLGFSLRKLRSDYTGFCVRVRRSSDNTSLDIGFVNNVIDTATLLSFVGSSSCYVTIWYNQATSNDAFQSTAVNQPRIVNAGVLEAKNGKPAIYFGGNQFLQMSVDSSLFINPWLFQFVVCSANNLTGLKGIVSLHAAVSGIGRYSVSINDNVLRGFIAYSGGDNLPTTPFDSTSQAIITHSYKNGTYNRIKRNTVESSLPIAGVVTPMGQPSVTFKIGCITSNNLVSGVFFHQGHIQEVVNYYNDQEATKTGIENNINNFYGTY